MRNLLFIFFANIFFAAACWGQTQTLRGTVSDQDSGQALAGATIILLKTGPANGTSTDSLGHFRLENVPVGRCGIKVSYVGYETVLIAGILVETGKEAIQNIILKEQPAALGEVEVRARGSHSVPHPLSNYQLKVEEQFRFPATYYDPARLAMSLPGMVGTDDQANNISVRGNPPASLRWRLEGVEIVNPNHLANAGTFSDRPTAAGGGVNILSAQLLDQSNFLTGAFPAGYGNALGGIMDMYFRKGNDERREFTLQAGLIGVEVAAEGSPLPASPKRGGESLSQIFGNNSSFTSPHRNLEEERSPQIFGDGSTSSPFGGGREGAYLINYRYSFVGILTAAGADFGGEEITFQDLAFHLDFPTKKGGEIGFFGMGGLSENIFGSPLEREKIKEDKDRFNIDFASKMGAVGMTFRQSLGGKMKLRVTAAYSGLEHERTADLVALVPSKTRWGEDKTVENKLAFAAKFFYKKNARKGWELGMQAMRERSVVHVLFTDNSARTELDGKLSGWLLQPYVSRHSYLSPKLKLTAGLQWNYFGYKSEHSLLEPRFSLQFAPNEKQKFSLAYALLGQVQQPQIYLAAQLPNKGPGHTKSHHFVFAFRQIFKDGVWLEAEVYYQHLFDVPVSVRQGSTYSVLNGIDNFRLPAEMLAASGKGQNYGIDFFYERPILKNSFYRLGASLYRSLYTAQDGAERPTRFDGRYLVTNTFGREKVKKKKHKTVVRGGSLHIVWQGGLRQTPIDRMASAQAGRTVYFEGRANEMKLKKYFRADGRIYWKWNKPKHSSTLSIDIQNLSGTKNEAYLYFDVFLQQVRAKKQLGLIPLVSYRLEF
ncbi:MAG TPA: TonB-dependent receptor [Bacteroidetes bacterium]|nr:TonB-dependent receptor [Bacteroidota bacterium]